jgi:hypothetical protein
MHKTFQIICQVRRGTQTVIVQTGKDYTVARRAKMSVTPDEIRGEKKTANQP